MKIKCRYCNTTVQTRKEYSKHLEMHEKYNFTCPECGKTFYSSRGFRHHEDVHQPKSQCEICNNSFSYKTTLQQHRRLQHGIT
uniref:Zinc finger protein n=2 Tax=Loa loa TaxID=7209 RepID=A0A1I7VF14_LOALO